jgi:uncharacterized protein (TIGR02145 family)
MKIDHFILSACLSAVMAFMLAACGQHSFFDDILFGTSSSSGSGGNSEGTLTYEGKTYKTVRIGNQTWMAENLNYNASNSRCYDEDISYCNKYGRLYDWATVMALPSTCNSSTCSSQIQPMHKGICPSGWHVPNQLEWEQLSFFVTSRHGDYTDAKHLKAKNGWGFCDSSGSDETWDCEDTYGFTALPGGYGYGYVDHSRGAFIKVGDWGNWWSASEKNNGIAYGRLMYGIQDGATWDTSNKSYWHSARCVKDEILETSSSSRGGGSSSPSNGNSFIDLRDGTTYNAVKIGNQTWMAQNLSYRNASGHVCYNNESSCDKYGMLYNWLAAMMLPSNCGYSNCADQIQPKHRGICPEGWHIPNSNEWGVLFDFAGGDEQKPGKHLKAKSGWNKSGNGLDTYGFAALPGGQGSSDGSWYGTYIEAGDKGYWWTSVGSGSGNSGALCANMSHLDGAYRNNFSDMNNLYSIRCLKD